MNGHNCQITDVLKKTDKLSVLLIYISMVKAIVISSLVVAAIYLEFHRVTSRSAVLVSSGFSVLWNFDQVAQELPFILFNLLCLRHFCLNMFLN